MWACALGGFPSVTVAVAPRLVASNAVAAKLLAALAQLDGGTSAPTSWSAAPRAPAGVAVHTASAVAAAASAADADPRPLDAAACAPGAHAGVRRARRTPKAIAETHGAIVAHIRQSAQCGCRADDTTLNWLPFDHVVPMVTYHLADVYLGRSAIQLPTAEVIADPLLWLRTMARFRVSHSWAPNFGFKLVAAALREAGAPPPPDLSCVRALMNAGEQVTADVCDAFLRLAGLPRRVMQPAFGMAETCTCITYCNDYDAGALLRVRHVRRAPPTRAPPRSASPTMKPTAPRRARRPRPAGAGRRASRRRAAAR